MKTNILALWLLCFPLFANSQTNQQQGFFFFYSSACPWCQKFAPILKDFSESTGFEVIAISMDGGVLPDFPAAIIDEGQSRLFNITTLPSLFLINPETQVAKPVSEGAISADELRRRMHILLQNKGGHA